MHSPSTAFMPAILPGLVPGVLACALLAGCGGEPASDAAPRAGGAASSDSASNSGAESEEPDDARRRFHGVGQEPGWFIDLVENGEIVIEYDYAQKQARFPFPREVEGKAVRYATETESDRLELTITATSCTDPMNGRSYPQTVTAVVNGERLKGCGRWQDGPDVAE